MGANKRRVAITGMGAITPSGVGIPALYDALYHGKSSISTVTKFDISDFQCKVAAEIRDFAAKNYGIPRALTRTCDIFSEYTLVAVQEAVNDSGLDLEQRTREELKDPVLMSSQIEQDFEEGKKRAVVIGSGMGGMQTILDQHERLMKGLKVSPVSVPQAMVNSASVAVSLLYKGLNAYTGANSQACATGLFSIREGFKLIKYREADVVIAGGSEAILNPVAFSSFQNIGALSTGYNAQPEKASRPYDAERDGFVLSEGAGIVILEDMEYAKKRGAKILAEILGFGVTTDGYHISAPHKDAFTASKAIEFALAEADVKPEQIDLINPHGTSTEYNDKFESLALRKSLGDYSAAIPVIPTKCIHGHMIGATSAVETIATMLAMQNSVIFPHINYDNPDPECNLRISKERIEDYETNVFLKNASGFGGHNIAMLARKFEE